MSRNFFWVLCWLLANAGWQVHGQDNPLVWTIPSAEYQLEGRGLSPQIRQFLQMPEGWMLMANTTGVLSFDGRVWQVVHGTEGSRFRLASSPEGQVFAFGEAKIGRIQPTPLGQPSFVPISFPPETGFPLREAFQILATGWGIHFFSDQQFLTCLPGSDSFFVTQSPGTILHACPGPDSSSVWLILREGVFAVGPEGGRWISNTSLAGLEEIREGFISPGSSPDRYQLILVSLEKGIWEMTPSSLRQVYPGQPSASPDLLWHATRLHDGSLAVATQQSGLLILSPDLSRSSVLSASAGLPQGTLHQVFEDREQGLWVAGESSIARFPFPLPLQIWGENAGLGGVVTAILPKKERFLVGTFRGLFEKKTEPTTETPIWQPLFPDEVYQVWALAESPDGIWIAASSGLFLLQGNRLQRLNEEVTMAVAPSRYDPGLVVAGLYDGAGTVRKSPAGWTWEGRLPGWAERTQSLLETSPGTWWMTYKRLARISGVGSPQTAVFVFDSLQGWSESMRTMQLLDWEGQPAIGSDLGLWVAEQDSLRPVLSWNEALPLRSPMTKLVKKEAGDRFWVYNGRFVGLMTSRQGRYSWQNRAISSLRADVWALQLDSEGVLWLGSNDGLLRFDPGLDQGSQVLFRAYLREVRLEGDSILTLSYQNQDLPTFPHGGSDLLFDYGAIGFTFPQLAEFQFMLEGYDDNWSEWTRSPEREKYTLLKEGPYRFRVRARDLFGRVSEEASFAFVVLPPWYRTWWAALLYLGVLAAVVFVIVQARTRAARKKLEAKERELDLERKTTERLRAIDQLKDQFLANTSHELRTPLTGIIGLAESMSLNSQDPATASQLDLIVSSGKRLHHLVNDILDFSKLKHHEIDLQKKPVDLRGMAEVVCQLYQPLLEGKTLKLMNLVPEDFPLAEADEDRISQVLHNLVGNAIKFTDSGQITLEGSWDQQQVTLTVRDTGIGISPEHQGRIFQAFEQVDGSIQRQYAGTGLGLAISQQLLSLHGGSLSVESEPGAGSAFSFSLPRSAASATLPAASASRQKKRSYPEPVLPSPVLELAPGPAEGNSRFRILIVDDEPINQAVMRAHLNDPRFELVTASRGAQALQIIDEDPNIDLVVLDVMMPGMSGFEVCRAIRKRFLPSELPVIIVTAKDQVEDLVQAFSFGANDYLAKPFSRAEFMARVNTQLQLRHIHEATSQFVPDEFLRALGRQAITDARYGDQVARNGTVLFADIRNYTSIAEQLSPEETFLFLNAYYSRMGPVIREQGGFINQFIGDGLMALFLGSGEDALRAGLGMQQALALYNVERQKKGFTPLQIGIGIHTGRLMMGIIGDGRRMDTGLVADTVNAAARLESLTKILGAPMLLSNGSMQEVANPSQYAIRRLGKVLVKGKEQAIELIEALDAYPEEVLQRRKASVAKLDTACDHYQRKEFDQALALFNELAEADPEDRPVQFLREETLAISQRSLPSDWPGCWEIKMK